MQHIYKDLWEISSSWPAKQSLREKRGQHPTFSATDLEDDNSHREQTSREGTLCTAAPEEEDVGEGREARKWQGKHKQEGLVLGCR